jgi:hypothetical protein
MYTHIYIRGPLRPPKCLQKVHRPTGPCHIMVQKSAHQPNKKGISYTSYNQGASSAPPAAPPSGGGGGPPSPAPGGGGGTPAGPPCPGGRRPLVIAAAASCSAVLNPAMVPVPLHTGAPGIPHPGRPDVGPHALNTRNLHIPLRKSHK